VLENGFDLDRDSREALEFDAVLDAVAAQASTVMGAERVRRLEPSSRIEAVRTELAVVGETRRLLMEGGRLVPRGLPHPEVALRGLPVEDLRIEGGALRDLAAVLAAAADLRARLLACGREESPNLHGMAGRVPDLAAEARPILANVGPDGRLADDASPELRRVRHAIARAGERLRRFLESFLHEPGSEAVIRDDFVTQRNGRFVVPVRADSPRPVKGIVHAASSSGATLFIEPLESVEWNNDLVRLAEEEAAEQDRVLQGWSRRLRDRCEDVLAAVAVLAEVDAVQARALFGSETGAVLPVVGEREPLVLDEVQHPLLEPHLRAQGKICVPLSLHLDPSDQVLLISGPNTGGKTVALKTVGLAVLMAHTAIPVPGRAVRVPVFRQVRADIGDRQSIAADLSTFSAHVRAVARFLGEAVSPALFLFDEIGTGTEPSEGAALAQAVLERLRAPGFTTVATTHQRVLKVWAFATPGAASAAMEFDEKTLQPTYRLRMGEAGVSAGIDIAARLGLDADLVGRARALLGEEARDTEAWLAKVRRLAGDLERQQQDLVRRDEELRRTREHFEAQATREREALRKEAGEALEAVLREFHEKATREIRAIADRKEQARLERAQFRAEQRLKADAGRQARKLAESSKTGGSEEAAPLDPRPGLRVRIRSLEREGEIVSVRGAKVEVRLGNVGLSVDRSDLEPVAIGETPSASRPASKGVRFRSEGEGRTSDLEEAPREILLIGQTVDEAIPALDKFLDGAALAGATEVRVIHGHGTGRLRNAVRRFLAHHEHVEQHRPGGPHEGGDGATVVRLR
jgi:DNA mismatch repair protein MutS2